MSGQGERKRRVIATRKADEERPVVVAAAKVVTVDERRNVMRNLPDPKHFPGESSGGPAESLRARASGVLPSLLSGAFAAPPGREEGARGTLRERTRRVIEFRRHAL
jgi:hypothetical protein